MQSSGLQTLMLCWGDLFCENKMSNVTKRRKRAVYYSEKKRREIASMYLDNWETVTQQDVAEMYGCSAGSVSLWAKKERSRREKEAETVKAKLYRSERLETEKTENTKPTEPVDVLIPGIASDGSFKGPDGRLTLFKLRTIVRNLKDENAQLRGVIGEDTPDIERFLPDGSWNPRYLLNRVATLKSQLTALEESKGTEAELTAALKDIKTLTEELTAAKEEARTLRKDHEERTAKYLDLVVSLEKEQALTTSLSKQLEEALKIVDRDVESKSPHANLVRDLKKARKEIQDLTRLLGVEKERSDVAVKRIQELTDVAGGVNRQQMDAFSSTLKGEVQVPVPLGFVPVEIPEDVQRLREELQKTKAEYAALSLKFRMIHSFVTSVDVL